MDAGIQGGVDVLSTAVQVGVGLIFASAGLGKVLRWHEFKGTLGAYEIVPSRWVPAVATVLVPAEMVMAAALIAGWNVYRFSLLAAALLAVFAAAMAINLARGRASIDCGCFQSSRQTIGWRLVARNLVCALAVVAGGSFTMPLDDPQRWIQAVPAGVALYAIYVALNGVWTLDASRAVAFRRN